MRSIHQEARSDNVNPTIRYCGTPRLTSSPRYLTYSNMVTGDTTRDHSNCGSVSVASHQKGIRVIINVCWLTYLHMLSPQTATWIKGNICYLFYTWRRCMPCQRFWEKTTYLDPSERYSYFPDVFSTFETPHCFSSRMLYHAKKQETTDSKHLLEPFEQTRN